MKFLYYLFSILPSTIHYFISDILSFFLSFFYRKEVVKKMAEVFKSAGIVAVTNDGPKGPPRIAKAGSTGLALKYNVQIITITGSATKYWQMKSWDRFMLPKPFGKIQLIVSPPLNITEELKTAEEEIQNLSDFMNWYQDEADRLTGKIS